VLIRHADDLVALCTIQAQAERVKASLAEWLAPRGLAFNEDRTCVLSLDEGFDFPGFTGVPDGQPRTPLRSSARMRAESVCGLAEPLRAACSRPRGNRRALLDEELL
jgi:hypothetical protein